MADPLFDYVPPRWRTLRRVGIGLAVLVLTLATLRTVIGLRVGRRLADAERQTRAAGDPWSGADLQHPPVAPGQNAADLYRQAFALKSLTINGPAASNVDPSDLADPRHNVLWRRMASESAVQHAGMLKLVHDAAALPECDWGTPWATATNLSTLLMRYYSPMRDLANETGDHALLRHFEGDEAAALDGITDMLALSGALEVDRLEISHLVAVGCYALACDRAQQIAVDLDTAKPGIAERVRLLMKQLEAEENRVRRMGSDALVGEVVMARSTVDGMRGNAWMLRPVFDSGVVDFIDRTRTVRTALSAGATVPPDPNARQNSTAYLPLGNTGVPLTPPVWPMAFLRNYALESFVRYPEVDSRIILESRLLRTLLAVRLFRVDRGRWPASVDELVPGYLASVPRGPTQAETARVEFTIIPKGRPDGADRPMLYLDRLHGRNAPPDEYAVGWAAQQHGGVPADEFGRQWRDAEAWPASAYPKRPMPVSADADPSTQPAGD